MTDTESISDDDFESQGGAAGAPYMSYRGLINLINRLQTSGTPAVFDKSYFGNQSGSLTAQIRSTMKILDLIDDQYRPTDRLIDLVMADVDGRKALLLATAKSHYADALSLGPNATAGQLVSVFRARNLSGATIEKAISFYLALLDDVGLEYSPHFKRGRANAAGSGSAPRKKKIATRPSPEHDPINVDVSTNKPALDQQAKYVEMLMMLASDATPDARDDLLDRIERALQIGREPAREGGTPALS